MQEVLELIAPYTLQQFFSFFLLNLAELHDYTHSRHIP